MTIKCLIDLHNAVPVCGFQSIQSILCIAIDLLHFIPWVQHVNKVRA